MFIPGIGILNIKKFNKTLDRAVQLNIQLSEIEKRIHAIYDDLCKHTHKPNLSMIRDKYREKDESKPTLLSLCDEYISNMVKLKDRGFTEGTISHYEVNRNKIAAFLKQRYKKNDIDLLELNFDFINNFEIFCVTEYDNGVETIGKHCGRLKRIVKYGIKKGCLDKDPFIGHKAKSKRTNRRCLTIEELQKIENVILKQETTRAIVRDVYLVNP